MLSMITKQEHKMATRIKREKTHFRQCPSCDKQVGHISARARRIAVNRNNICNSCARERCSPETRAKIGAAHKGKIVSTKARANIVASKKIITDAYTEMYGEKSSLSSGHGKIKKWSKAVKERDNYTCLRCSKKATGYNINAHHVIPKEYYLESAFDIDNGVTLCAPCHRSFHAFVDRLTLSGVKLDAEGFRTHTSRFINGNKATNVPTEYKPVFSPSVTITTE